MDCVAVKFNFLTHSMAQGKKQQPLTRDGIPAPSTNIQEAVIQGYTVKGKDVVRLHVALCAVVIQTENVGLCVHFYNKMSLRNFALCTTELCVIS